MTTLFTFVTQLTYTTVIKIPCAAFITTTEGFSWAVGSRRFHCRLISRLSSWTQWWMWSRCGWCYWCRCRWQTLLIISITTANQWVAAFKSRSALSIFFYALHCRINLSYPCSSTHTMTILLIFITQLTYTTVIKIPCAAFIVTTEGFSRAVGSRRSFCWLIRRYSSWMQWWMWSRCRCC